MSHVAVLDSAWSALVTRRLVDAGLRMEGVIAEQGEIRRIWALLAAATGVRLLTEADPMPDGVDAAMTFGAGLPDWFDPDGDKIPILLVSIQEGSPYESGDPLRWAVLHDAAEATLSITLVDRSLTHRACVAGLRVPTAGLDYDQIATALADTLVSRPESVRPPELVGGSTCACGPTRVALEAPASTEQPFIDWADPADRIVRTVRAAVPGIAPARTWLKEFPISIGRARTHAPAAPQVPPGTIVGDSADGILVVSGTGLVAIDEIRDLIGPLDNALLPAGTRLGVDPYAEVTHLRRRIGDVEEVVRWLAADLAHCRHLDER